MCGVVVDPAGRSCLGSFTNWTRKERDCIDSPACNSRVPLSNDASWSFVSAVAAWAVGVDPTDNTNGMFVDAAAGVPCNRDSASPAAVFTESTSDDRKAVAALREVEA